MRSQAFVVLSRYCVLVSGSSRHVSQGRGSHWVRGGLPGPPRRREARFRCFFLAAMHVRIELSKPWLTGESHSPMARRDPATPDQYPGR
jgi:hypothetical protein